MRVRGSGRLVVAAGCVMAALIAVAALSPTRTAGPCRTIGDAAMLRDVPEASGLAVSRRHQGLLWTHNDSGNDTVLFAVDVSGEERGHVRVPTRTRDWEDLSAGACPPFDNAQGRSGACLYVADIGDNTLARSNVQVLRVPEPEPNAAQTARPDAFTLTYPDGPHNAEALFVVDGTVFVVTKDRSGVVYRSTRPLGDQRSVTLQQVRQLGLVGVTDAEASPDGKTVVVRTPDEVVLYRTADLLDGGSASGIVRIDVDGLREPQGEGVALDGDVLYLASEGRAWSRAGRLLSLRCSLP